MVTPDDEKKAAGVQGKADKTFNNAVKSMKEMVSLSEKFAKNYEKAAKAMAEATGGKYTGESKLGLGQFTRNQKIAGGVAIGAAAAGSLFMGMAPNTMAAVGQRMSLDTYAGLSGMSTRQALGLANRQVGNGATSAMGPSKAAMTASYSGGYLASTLSSRNIMQSVGGLSAITGGSNEQVAAGLSAMNGMNFLRMGVSIRDSRGQLKPTNQIINDTYRFLYGGKNITPEQAQMVFNPSSKGYQTLMAVSGGDPGLLQILQSGIVARANNKKGLTKSDLSNSNKALDIMKVEKSSPLRAQFRYNTSEARKLQATESGLVGGYNVALRTTASVNDGFSSLAEALPAVTQALMTFKGALQTFPGAGNTGATLSNLGSAAAGGAMNIGQMMLAGKLLGVGGGGPKLGSVLSKGGSFMSGTFGKAVPVLGTLLSAYGGYKHAKGHSKFSWGEVLKAAGVGAAGGAIAGAVTTGGLASGPAAIIGALLAGGGNAVGQMFGRGGGDCAHGNVGAHACGMGGDNAASSPKALQYQAPVPPGTPITSGFGPRDNSKNPQISSTHSGVDYGVVVGTSVTAAADGVVTETGLHRQYGNYVIIRHGDKSTLYGHLSQILVKRGEKVSQGYVIGKSGGRKGAQGAGTSTGPHLHFEIRNNGGVGAKGRRNPLGLLGKAWNIIKNIGGGAIKAVGNLFGMAKKIANGQGSAFSFGPDKGSLSSLSSSNLGSLLSSSIASGSPISWDDVSNQVNGNTKVGLGRKGQSGSAYLNNTYDATPGDTQGMTGGSRAGLMKMLYAKGFRGKALHTAFAVALAESGGRADAVGDKTLVNEKWGPSYGAFQIRSLNNWKKYNDPYRDASRLKNGSFNLDAAFKKSNGGNSWKGWSTFTSGGFTKYLDDASKAASAAGFGKGGDTEGTGSTAGMALSTTGMAGAVSGRSSSTSSLSTSSKVDINVTMNVNIAKASQQEVQVLMETFSNKLETELRLKGIGTY
jgi:hypothetical protein